MSTWVSRVFSPVFSPRWAWLHFAAIGALLFAAQHGLPGAAPARAASSFGVDWARAPEEEVLYREALRRGLDRRDSVVRQRLVRNMRFLQSRVLDAGEQDASPSQDEALYREALALELDRSDPVVRRRLVERMRETLIAEAAIGPPDDNELSEHLLANRQRFEQPARRRIEQLYYATQDRARDALATLGPAGEHETLSPVAAWPIADPLPIPRKLPSLSQRELAARLGDSFAREVFALPLGRWSGPIASVYGAHLVRLVERGPARAPAATEIRGALRAHWLANREERSVRVAVAALRLAYGSNQRGGQGGEPP